MNAAKEKAKELVEKFNDLEICTNHTDILLDGHICTHLAKQCAIIACDEVIKSYEFLKSKSTTPSFNWLMNTQIDFEKQVNKEIELL